MKLMVTDLTEKDRKEIADTINQAGDSAFSEERGIFRNGYYWFDEHCVTPNVYEEVLANRDDLKSKRMRIIGDRLRQDNLDPRYWYLFEEPIDGMMRMVCPFIGKEVSFIFGNETNTKSTQRDPLLLIGFDYWLLPIGATETTQDLIEAILLDQSSLY